MRKILFLSLRFRIYLVFCMYKSSQRKYLNPFHASGLTWRVRKYFSKTAAFTMSLKIGGSTTVI